MTSSSDSRSGRGWTRSTQEFLKGLVPAAQPERELLDERLRALLPTEIADQVQVISLRRGTVTIEATSSCLIHELRNFRNAEILSAFQEELDQVRARRLVYRLTSSLPER